MSDTERRAFEFARHKAAREQRDIAVYRVDSNVLDVQPVALSTEEDGDPIRVFKGDNVSAEERARIFREIDDFTALEQGDRVVVGEQPEHITRVTKILFETESGARFLRSDGTGYGDETRVVTRAVNAPGDTQS